MYEPVTKIIIDSYQSIGHAELQLGSFTVIVGRGNLGKSAILRAVAGAMFNDTGTGFIRQGEKQTNVELQFGDDALLWVKPTEGGARYVLRVGGKEQNYTKLGANVPDDVRDYLGIRQIEIDKTFSICPQIHSQFDAPLLLTESPGKAARALAKLTKLEMIMQAQVAAARDLRRSKTDITAREREATELTVRLEELPNLKKVDKRLVKARKLFVDADARLNTLATAEEAFDLMESAKRRLEVTPPSVANLGAITTRLDKMAQCILAMKVVAQAVEGVKLTKDHWAVADTDLANEHARLDVFMAELDICPICGRPMSKGSVHND